MAGRARRHSGGSVRKVPSGRWQVRVLDRATNRYVSLGTYRTKADANAALAGATVDVQRGTFVPPERGQIALRDHAAEWLDHHPGLAPKTETMYRTLLRLYIDPHLGGSRLADIQPSTVNAWYARLGKTTSRSNQAKAYRLLRAMLNGAVKDRRILFNPCQIENGGTEYPEERPIATIPQVFAIADAMPEHLRAIVLVAAFGSLRVGECAGLQRGDVDPLGLRVHVRRQLQRDANHRLLVREPKMQSRRTVTMPPQVMRQLEAHMDAFTGASPDAWVFTHLGGGPIDSLYVGKHWRKAVATAAVEDPSIPPKLRFHDLRGSGATLASAQGATLKEVMDRLGHKSMRAAMLYQHASADRADTIAQLLGNAIDQAVGPVIDLDERRSAARPATAADDGAPGR